LVLPKGGGTSCLKINQRKLKTLHNEQNCREFERKPTVSEIILKKTGDLVTPKEEVKSLGKGGFGNKKGKRKQAHSINLGGPRGGKSRTAC